MNIRLEEPADVSAVRGINLAAFQSSLEADIVDALRGDSSLRLSLVADAGGELLGHIAFSPVMLAGNPGLSLIGLGPMSVIPDRQRQGIGSALVRRGLEWCRQMGCVAVVVLGHSGYYPRFGFVPASGFGVSCEYEVADEAFMLLELAPGSLQGVSGRVTYHDAFRGEFRGL